MCTQRPWGRPGSGYEAFWAGFPGTQHGRSGHTSWLGTPLPWGEVWLAPWNYGVPGWGPWCPLLRVMLRRGLLAVRTWATEATWNASCLYQSWLVIASLDTLLCPLFPPQPWSYTYGCSIKRSWWNRPISCCLLRKAQCHLCSSHSETPWQSGSPTWLIVSHLEGLFNQIPGPRLQFPVLGLGRSLRICISDGEPLF